jgi:hypothetical protein
MSKKRRSINDTGSVNSEPAGGSRSRRSPNNRQQMSPEGASDSSPVLVHHSPDRRDSQSFLPAPEWLSKMYEADATNDDGRPQRSCLSVSVLLFSIFFILVGLGIAAVSIVEEHGDRFLKLCPHCQGVINAAYVAAAMIAVIGMLGVVAAVLRRRVLAIPFTVLMIILATVFLTLAIVALVYRHQVNDVDLQSLWRSAVSSDPQFICSVQDNLGCSGFRDGCCTTNATFVALDDRQFCYINTPSGLDVDPQRGVAVAWPSLDCVASCPVGNLFNTTCQAALHNEVSEYLAPVVAILISLACCLLLIGVCSILMIRKPRREENQTLV